MWLYEEVIHGAVATILWPWGDKLEDKNQLEEAEWKKQNGTMEEFGSLMTYLHSHTKTRTIAFHLKLPQACFHRSLDKVSVKKKKVLPVLC